MIDSCQPTLFFFAFWRYSCTWNLFDRYSSLFRKYWQLTQAPE